MCVCSSKITTGTINKKINLICDSLLIFIADFPFTCTYRGRRKIKTILFRSFFLPLIHPTQRWSKAFNCISFIFQSFSLFAVYCLLVEQSSIWPTREIKYRKSDVIAIVSTSLIFQSSQQCGNYNVLPILLKLSKLKLHFLRLLLITVGIDYHR